MSRPSFVGTGVSHCHIATLISLEYPNAKTIVHNGLNQGQLLHIYITGKNRWHLDLFNRLLYNISMICLSGKVYLHSLNFQFHVILPGSFPVLPLLPTVSVPSVADFLARVEKHRPGLWPKFKLYKTWQGKIQLLVTDTPYLNFLR